MRETFEKAFQWCVKYAVFFRTLSEDDELQEFFKKYNVYQPPQGHPAIYKILDECQSEAYDDDVVITNYNQIIEDCKLDTNDVTRPTDKWVKTLNAEQILACIAWHFRRDHYKEGSWISDSVAEGYMRVLVDGFIEKIIEF